MKTNPFNVASANRVIFGIKGTASSLTEARFKFKCVKGLSEKNIMVRRGGNLFNFCSREGSLYLFGEQGSVL